MYMKLKGGKSKVLTLSYDDGVVQDIRLVGIMDKYGIKGTFNINSGRYFPEDGVRDRYYGRMKLSEARELYTNSGHEIAVHSFTHPHLERLEEEEILTEILNDRKCIEKDYNIIPRGMAYPYGTYDDRVIKCLQMCGICYSRTVKRTECFDFPENWLTLHPTCHHSNPRLMELAKSFVEDTCSQISEKNKMFYLWGHSYEFDNEDNWNVIEKFCAYMGNREDIWYATNIEIFDYVMAYQSLQFDEDKKNVHNPTDIDVWFVENNITYCVRGGNTLCLDK